MTTLRSEAAGYEQKSPPLAPVRRLLASSEAACDFGSGRSDKPQSAQVAVWCRFDALAAKTARTLENPLFGAQFRGWTFLVPRSPPGLGGKLLCSLSRRTRPDAKPYLHGHQRCRSAFRRKAACLLLAGERRQLPFIHIFRRGPDTADCVEEVGLRDERGDFVALR